MSDQPGADYRSRRYEMTSHEGIAHDDLASLGFDWSRAADPTMPARRPLVVYFPETTAEVAAIVQRCHERAEPFRIRSRGHSSNDLVLGGREVSILCTEHLHAIDAPDTTAETVRVQSGAVLSAVDRALAPRGFGLPVIGDHNHITAGGFASVGGVSPASHREGMFIDNIVALEYVDASGAPSRCVPADAVFARLVGGTGRFGVITALTLRIVRLDKRRQILRNRRQLTGRFATFVERSAAMIDDPGGAMMERSMWFDLPLPFGGALTVGSVSRYESTEPAAWKTAWNAAMYGLLHTIGWFAGRLPGWCDRVLQYLGVAGVLVSPRYASVANVEAFADKIIDSSVGDPTRMFIVFPPAERYAEMVVAVDHLCRRYRERWGCFTFLCMYVKGLRSPYLARAAGDPRREFSEIVMYHGVVPERLRGVLDLFVGELDDLCIAHDAFRYMHTRTVAPDDPRRLRIDPNEALAALTPHRP